MRQKWDFERIRLFIGGIGFKVFLWSINATQEDYWQEIVDQWASDRH